MRGRHGGCALRRRQRQFGVLSRKLPVSVYGKRPVPGPSAEGVSVGLAGKGMGRVMFSVGKVKTPCATGLPQAPALFGLYRLYL